MLIKQKRTIYEEIELPECVVFVNFIKHIEYYKPDNEVDFFENGNIDTILSIFNTIPAKDLNENIEELQKDISLLSIIEFWDKYKKKLEGKWFKTDKNIILT